MARAIAIVRQLAPKAKAQYLAAFEKGDSLLQQHGITTPDRLAHFLAQVLHESGGLTLEHENMNYGAERLVEVFGVGRHSAAITPLEAQRLAHDQRAIAERVYGIGNPGKAKELGNRKAGDGFKFRGSGLMQTTGRANYRRMGQICGVDFENNPDLVFSPEHALKPALAEWSEAGLNVFADNNDILAISRAINCGSPRSKRTPIGLPDRVNCFAKARPLIERVDFQAGAAPVPAPSQPATEPPAPAMTPPAVADLAGDRIFQVGDEGPVVRAVQLALARLGYPLRGSGSFADATLRAVTDFQRKRGLEIDGQVGLETAKAIDRALAEMRPESPAGAVADLVGDRILRTGDAGSTVQAVQLGLARLGYPLKGTGNFGPATEQAVRDFQTRRGLEIDGEVGAETAKAIDRALIALSQPAANPAGGGASPVVPGSRSPAPQPGQRPSAGSVARFSVWAIQGPSCRGFNWHSPVSAIRSRARDISGEQRKPP
jgi:predicted chitinase/peptidoglycan hydrolase-like protein with peptidoglycan-binding domain